MFLQTIVEPDYTFTKRFVEYIQDNSDRHIEHTPNDTSSFFAMTHNSVDDKEDWWKLAETLKFAKFKTMNFIDEVNLVKYDGKYHLSYKMRNED